MAAKLPNPYRPGGPLHKGELFVGRENETRQIMNAYKKNQSVSIHGERRIGKTSLLFQLKDELAGLSPEAKVEYMTFEVIPNMDNFFDRLAALLGVKQWSTAMDFEPALQQQPVILLLDEFDRALRDEDFTADFFSILRGWDVQDWIYLIVSTQKPLSHYAGQGAVTSPFGNTFLSLSLDGLEDEAAMQLLQPLNKLVNHWEKDWQAKTLSLTESQPWKIQLFGYHVFHLLANRASATFQEACDLYKDVFAREQPETSAGNGGEAADVLGQLYANGETVKPRVNVPSTAIGLLVAAGSLMGLLGVVGQSTFLAGIGVLLILAGFVSILLKLRK